MTGPQKFKAPRFAVREGIVDTHKDRRTWPRALRAMQKARKREAEWRAYQATWQKPIDEIVCTAEDFYQLRRNVLGLNRHETARLFRVSVKKVLNWERGTTELPFYAYLALLLVSQSQHYRLANEAWRDWEFGERYDANARLPMKRQGQVFFLVNRKTGAYFEPEHLNSLHATMQELARLDSKRYELEQRVGSLTAENTSLRKMFLADGVTAELHDMQDRLQKLLGRVNTAEVLNLPKVAAAR